MPDGKTNQHPYAVEPEFFHYVCAVPIYCVDTEIQIGRNFFVGLAFCDQLQNLAFPRAERQRACRGSDRGCDRPAAKCRQLQSAGSGFGAVAAPASLVVQWCRLGRGVGGRQDQPGVFEVHAQRIERVGVSVGDCGGVTEIQCRQGTVQARDKGRQRLGGGAVSEAGGVMVGFLSHLILDELCSVDFMGLRPHLNKYAGSALKFFSASWSATFLAYAILGGLCYLAYLDW